eukprot:gb/GECH01011691.1/.p1 GENE.gb/GECH01011691.1/~~gb/GECH01011691.1/.p1  ORF type:complete len:459 (+),score=67.15 gb/GECH01011691.1/:1-1377(+)
MSFRSLRNITTQIGLLGLWALVLTIVVPTINADDHPSFDHQNKTYHADHKPITTYQSQATVTPFFSPDHSADTLVKVIESASQFLDVGTPSFSSWSGCTPFNSNCSGCTPEYMRKNEAFPVWQALLNAIHRGVKVRILTNDFNEPNCPGKTSPLTFLALAGAQVHNFATTTFLHTKYINADRKRAAVSSINFSYTSFMENREAGVVIEDSEELVGFLNKIYDFDWHRGYDFQIHQKYSKHDLEVIHNPNPIPVNIPDPRNFSCATASPTPRPVHLPSHALAQIFAGPDYSYDKIMQSVKNANTSLIIEIYQITDEDFCDLLVKRHKEGLDMKILVSDRIYSDYDYWAAQKCYKKLYYNGYRKLRKTAPHCLTYSHQKFWIVDEKDVLVSTGNLSPTDMPSGSDVFPPYPSDDWRRVNRDYTVHMTDPSLVKVFKTVFENDSKQGFHYKPFDNSVQMGR